MDGARTLSCEPYPDEEPPSCDPGEAAFPGEDACAPLGEPCPASGFATDLVDDGTVRFVDSAASRRRRHHDVAVFRRSPKR